MDVETTLVQGSVPGKQFQIFMADKPGRTPATTGRSVAGLQRASKGQEEIVVARHISKLIDATKQQIRRVKGPGLASEQPNRQLLQTYTVDTVSQLFDGFELFSGRTAEPSSAEF